MNSKRKCALKDCGQRKPYLTMIVKGTQAWCGIDCQVSYALQAGAKLRQRKENEQKKAEREKRKAERKDIRERKQKLNDVSLKYQHKQTQPVFNTLIRLLDALQPCISCGRYDHEIPDQWIGGKWDCGHFLTVGAHPHLRYTFVNAYKQCKGCNSGSYHHARKQETVRQDYEKNLIERMGQCVVDWLKGPHEQAKFKPDWLIQFRAEMSAEIRRLEKGEPPSRNWRALPEPSQQQRTV